MMRKGVGGWEEEKEEWFDAGDSESLVLPSNLKSAMVYIVHVPLNMFEIIRRNSCV
jgi:hypothetical protein